MTTPIDDTTGTTTPEAAEDGSTALPVGNNDSSGADVEPAEGDDTGEPSDDASDEHPNAEAARYRTRLREAEATVTALTEQVTALQRQHVEAITSAAGVKPAALWAVTELPGLLNEDGTVAPEKVHEAIRTAEESLGLRLGLHVEREGYQPQEPGKPNAMAQWNQAFAPPVARQR